MTELVEIAAEVELIETEVVELFDTYEGTSAKAKLSKDLNVAGANFFAKKPAP